MLALILQAVQGANWQRSGGKGKPPDRITRPTENTSTIRTADELRRRRADAQAELARRRQRKHPKGA